jgi:hypothetical protein
MDLILTIWEHPNASKLLTDWKSEAIQTKPAYAGFYINAPRRTLFVEPLSCSQREPLR